VKSKVEFHVKSASSFIDLVDDDELTLFGPMDKDAKEQIESGRE
jgi:hypothetical protein